MKKMIFSLMLVCLLGSCANSNIEENKNEEKTILNNTELNITDFAKVTGTNITIEWMPKAYENEEFRKEAKKNKAADEILFTILEADIQASSESYEGQVKLIFTNILYTDKLEPRVLFAVVNKTGNTIQNLQFDMMIENKLTKERYIELEGVRLEGNLSVDIPNNTAYYYSVGAPSLIEQPIGTKIGQNDANVYVKNLTYDIVE